MKPVILVCGYGSGISDAVARRFGREGYAVALVARTGEKLAAAVTALAKDGIEARGFPADLGDDRAVRAVVREVHDGLGPIAVVHWNAYRGGAGDLATASSDELTATLAVSVQGLVAAVQAALPDLEAQKGAVLVTGGGLSTYDPRVDAMAVSWGAMGLAVAKAAQHKTAGLLHQALAPRGIYVGEVVVMGSVKGTVFDGGSATLEASAVADRFWSLARERKEPTVTIA